MKDLAKRIRVARLRMGFNQRTVGERSGIAFQTISAYETERRIERIQVAQVEKIAAACDMTLVEFLTFDVDAPFEAPPVEADAPVEKPFLRRVVDRPPLVLNRPVPVDPLAPFRRDSTYPTAQSSLGSSR